MISFKTVLNQFACIAELKSVDRCKLFASPSLQTRYFECFVWATFYFCQFLLSEHGFFCHHAHLFVKVDVPGTLGVNMDHSKFVFCYEAVLLS